MTSTSERGIARQSGSHVTPFEQIVAKDAIGGQPMSKRFFERVDVVNAFADERTFAERILVDVRHGTRIRIDAGVA